MIYVKYSNNNIIEFNNFDEIFDENQLDIIEINCSNNKLIKLPNEICNLVNLQTLNCYNNQLTELPNNMKKLINLKYLNLNTNKLKEIPNFENCTVFYYGNNIKIEHNLDNIQNNIKRFDYYKKINDSKLYWFLHIHNFKGLY